MALDIRKLSNALGAEVSGVDLGKPLDDATFAEIRAAFAAHCLLLFRDQPLTREAFVAFSRRFGPLDRNESRPAATKAEGYPELMLVVARPNADGTPASYRQFGADWHTDNSHHPVAAAATLLRAVELPDVGGDTLFANMYRAYDALSDGMKAMIEPLHGVHAQSSAVYDLSTPERAEASWKAWPAAAHPLVRVHPETGRKALYVNVQVRLLVGMTAAESKPLVEFLSQHAVDENNVYRHQWRKNDLVMWDNRCLLHRALVNYDRTQVRSMERTTVHGQASGYDYRGPMV